MKRIFFNHPDLIEKIKQKQVCMTTRTKPKARGLYKIVSGSFYKQKDSGLKIQILKVIKGGLEELSKYHSEHGFDTKQKYIQTIKKINKKIPRILYAHRFKLK